MIEFNVTFTLDRAQWIGKGHCYEVMYIFLPPKKKGASAYMQQSLVVILGFEVRGIEFVTNYDLNPLARSICFMSIFLL